MPRMAIRPNDALIVVDVQNDFCDGGRLAVPDGSNIVPVVNEMMGRGFGTVVLTQDWHPPDHSSFASNHASKRQPFETVDMPYGPQVLWPDHCVQRSDGAAFHPELDTHPAAVVIRKGMNPAVDSYSAFRENDRETVTGLPGYLRDRGVERVFIAGLALDFCVRYSAVDARLFGFEPVVLAYASRAIDNAGSLAAAHRDFAAHQVEVAEAPPF